MYDFHNNPMKNILPLKRLKNLSHRKVKLLVHTTKLTSSRSEVKTPKATPSPFKIEM
jgi:hypothetical protein